MSSTGVVTVARDMVTLWSGFLVTGANGPL